MSKRLKDPNAAIRYVLLASKPLAPPRERQLMVQMLRRLADHIEDGGPLPNDVARDCRDVMLARVERRREFEIADSMANAADRGK